MLVTPSFKISRRAFGSHYTYVSQLKVYALFSVMNACLAVMLFTP